jgi:hypothetical protein
MATSRRRARLFKMLDRRAVALATGLLGGSLLACTGSISEPSSEPGQRPTPVAAGAVDEAGGATATTSPIASGTAGAGARSEENVSGAGGASDELPDDRELPPFEFCDAPTKVLMASCGNGSCHSNANATIGDFAVDAERAYNFVDRVSVRNATCGKIIDSEDYSKSLLLTKVRGDFEVPKCGERMPIGSFVITAAQIDCLASWLQQFQL